MLLQQRQPFVLIFQIIFLQLNHILVRFLLKVGNLKRQEQAHKASLIKQEFNCIWKWEFQNIIKY